MRWKTGELKVAGIPATFWLTDGDEVPATFSLVDPDGVEWAWATFIGQQMIREGRAPLADAISAALRTAGISEYEMRRLSREFERMMD
jgi:hypothetical protein